MRFIQFGINPRVHSIDRDATQPAERSTTLDKTTNRNDAALPDKPPVLKEVIMNTKHLIAAVALALVGTSSFAFEGDAAPQPVSTLSRAVVKADLATAVANKALPPAGEVGYIPESTVANTSSLSRDEVRAQVRAYVRSGQAARDARAPSAVGG